MGLYERVLEEFSREERATNHDGIQCQKAFNYRRVWSRPVPEAGGYVTEEDLEREQERLQREQMKIRQQEEKQSKEVRVLRSFARHGVHSSVQGMAYKSLQRKYPADWDRIRWERRIRG